MIKNQANLFQFNIIDSAGAGRTGLTVTIKLRKDSGTFATATNSVTEVDTTNAPGLYAITLTATECNCDVLTVQATLSNGTNPAIIDSYDMQSIGTSAQDIWQYSSRTLSDTPITASDIWSYNGGRTVTNNIPTVAEIQSGLSTFNPEAQAVLVSNGSIGDIAKQVWKETNYGTVTDSAGSKLLNMTVPTVAEIQSGLATSAGLTALQNHGDTDWSTADTTTLATSSALSTVATDVTAVKAKTDNLPTAPASTSDVPSTADIWTYSNRSLTVAPSSLTAQEVWEYNGGRTITNTIPTVAEIQAGLATGTNVTDAVSAVKTYGDTNWVTATGFAEPGDAMTLTTDYDSAKTAVNQAGVTTALTSYGTCKTSDLSGISVTATVSTADKTDIAEKVWENDERTLTSGGLTAQQVWAYTTRRLTSSIPDESQGTADRRVIQ